jgi:hypothetical protein
METTAALIDFSALGQENNLASPIAISLQGAVTNAIQAVFQLEFVCPPAWRGNGIISLTIYNLGALRQFVSVEKCTL